MASDIAGLGHKAAVSPSNGVDGNAGHRDSQSQETLETFVSNEDVRGSSAGRGRSFWAWSTRRKSREKHKHERGRRDPVCPLEEANLFSLLTHAWVTPLVLLGKTKQLEQADLFPTHSRHTAAFLGSQLEAIWQPALRAYERGEGPRPKFWVHAMWPFRWRMLGICVLIVLESSQRILSAFTVRQLVRFLQGHGSQAEGRGYMLALLLFGLALAYAVIHHQCWNIGNILGWNLRVGAMTVVNRKLLALNQGSLAHVTVGHCINLMSTDVRRFDDLATYSHFIWAAPMELTVVATLISLELGVGPALAGIGVLIAFIPLQAVFGNLFAKQRKATVKHTDRRVKMTGEVLNGILAVKMFAWEAAFTQLIERIRARERINIQRSSYIKAFNEASFYTSSGVVCLVTFVTFHRQGGHLQPSSVFYVISLLQLTRLWICVFFPLAIERVAEACISFQRLQSFLELPEPSTELQHGKPWAYSKTMSRKFSSFRKKSTLPLPLPLLLAPAQAGLAVNNVASITSPELAEEAALSLEAASGGAAAAAPAAAAHREGQEFLEAGGEGRSADMSGSNSHGVSKSGSIIAGVGDDKAAGADLPGKHGDGDEAAGHGLPVRSSLHAGNASRHAPEAARAASASARAPATSAAGDGPAPAAAPAEAPEGARHEQEGPAAAAAGEAAASGSGEEAAGPHRHHQHYHRDHDGAEGKSAPGTDGAEALHAQQPPVVRVTGGVFYWAPPPPVKAKKTWLAFLRRRRRRGSSSSSKAGGAASSSGIAGATPHAETVVEEEEEEEERPHLDNITFELGATELLGLTGKVGSGKSTLLSALLGDLHFVEGTSQVTARRIGYASQKPFIVAGSLRENILFGLPFEAQRYEEVLDACALRRDIAELPHGDLTEIGERGINLSGGQKARVGLARVAYGDADLLLLDDPLSAVDPAVGKHLFEKCIRGLMGGKPCVLATHQLQYLPRCDRVLALSNGQMAGIGTYQDLQLRIGLRALVATDGDDADAHADADADADEAQGVPADDGAAAAAAADAHQQQQKGGKVEEGENTKENQKPVSASAAALVQAEGRAGGRVQWRVYLDYARSMGYVYVALLALFLVSGQAVLCAGDWFLGYWSQRADQGGAYVYAYAAIVLTAVSIAFACAACFFTWTVGAASRIHRGMLTAVLASPLAFFHSNPVGRVLNRFAADQGIMDDMLPITALNYYQTVCIAMGALVMVSIGVPWVTLSLVPLLAVFVRFRNLFLSTSRETKRLEAVSRSPIYAHYAAAIQGLSTIRAFGVQRHFDAAFQERLDANGRAFFAWLVTSRWLAFRLDGICSVVLLLASVLAIAARRQLSPSLVGLALTYMLQLSGMFQWAVRQSAEVENMFTGVERAIEYTKLPKEGADAAAAASKACVPPPEWPSRGEIVLERLTVRYRPGLEPVLSDLSVTFRAGHKCGIVGRTGAGKSTLMLTLFRLVEATSGRVLVDGVDTATIALSHLRKKVMAIPQDPVLFGVTLRFNLDPFGEYSDQRLWEALAAVQLRGKAEGLRAALDTSMAEYGENFSVGERQLVCLARAILQNNRILVIDEATANVDFETDALIQATLRDRFGACTVLNIAHRMDTIITADQILVLDHGRVREVGSPQALLADPEGAFSGMVRNSSAAAAAASSPRAEQAAAV